jgi:hypothetical protein
MKTLLIQTAIRPSGAPINFVGGLRQYWRDHIGATVLASHFDVNNDDETLSRRKGKAPVFVTFGANDPDDGETLITVRDSETGRELWSSAYTDRDTHLAIKGVTCDTTEECRTLLDIRDNPQSADVADEGRP